MEIPEPYILSEISNTMIFNIAVNTKYTCTTEESKLVFINNEAKESWNVMDLGENIKGLKLANKGNWLAVITSAKVLMILDLESRNVLHKFESPFCIEHFKWHNSQEGCFFMVRNDKVLEKWAGNESEFTLISLNVPSLMYFEIIPNNDEEIIFITPEGEVKILNIKEKTQKMIDKVELVEIGPLTCLDSDLLCLQTPYVLKFYSISHQFVNFIIRKTIFRYDPISQFLVFSDYLSAQIVLVAKDIFVNYKLDGEKIEVNLIENPLEIEVISNFEKTKVSIMVRHSQKIYVYPIVKLEKPSEKSFSDLQTSELYVMSKEGVNGIVENLFKKFDELMKKLDKTLLLASGSQNLSKTVQYSLDKKYEEIDLSLKEILLKSIIQSFKSEILNTLVISLETDIKEVLNKFSHYYHDRLKLKIERNLREEEKSKKLASHMKSCVIGFIGLDEQIAKTIKKKTKVLNEFDLKSLENNDKTESQQCQQIDLLLNLKWEVDKLLHKKNYEKAIFTVLQENKFELVCGVLDVLNPRPLILNHFLSANCALKLFLFLFSNIDKTQTFPDVYLWLEELVKEIAYNDIKVFLPKIFEAIYSYPQLNSVAKLCSKKIEEAYKYEIN